MTLPLFAGLGAGSVPQIEKKPEERTFQVHDHGYQLPVSIVEVRNLQAEHWIRDIEIVVKNVSEKPIYYIKIMVVLPDVIVRDSAYGISLRYGRRALIRIDERPRAGDVPLKAGETYVFKVDSALWTGFEHFKAERDLPEDATKRVLFRFQTINFGDGTGFVSGGVPVPQTKKGGSTGPTNDTAIRSSQMP
jgi:hypothetical protein